MTEEYTPGEQIGRQKVNSTLIIDQKRYRLNGLYFVFYGSWPLFTELASFFCLFPGYPLSFQLFLLDTANATLLPPMASGRLPLLAILTTCLLLMGCGLISTSMAADTNLQFKHLTTADGLPNSTILCFTQDKYGFIWMGTENGLCRYDGRSIKSYFYDRHYENSLPHNRVSALYTDADGKIWIGTAQGLAQFDYDTQTFRRFPFPAGTSVIAVEKICEASSGVLCIAMLKGIQFFDRKQLRFVNPIRDQQLKRRLDVLRIYQIKADKSGRVFLGTSDGLKVIDSQMQSCREYYHDPLTIDTSPILAFVLDDADHVWVAIHANETRLERLDLRSGHVERVTINQFANGERAPTFIYDLILDRQRHLWAATSLFGLLRCDPFSRQVIQYRQDLSISSGLRGQLFQTLFLDKEGQLWIGSALAGASWCYPNRSLFTVFQETQNPQTSLPNHWARAAVEDNDNNLWLGTGKGLVIFKNGQGFIRRYTAKDLPLPYYSIRSLARDSTGNIWVGTGDGLNRYSPRTRQMRAYTEPDSAGGAFYWSLLITRKGKLWAGASGGLRRYNAQLDRLEFLATDSLYRPYAHWPVSYLTEAADGGLWVGFLRNGLLYWHPERKQLKYYAHRPDDPSSLIDNYVTSIATDQFGWVWVATTNGLCALNPQTQRFKAYDHLFKPNIFGSLLVDRQNRLWLSTNDGLYCLGKDRKSVYRFDQGDGLPDNEMNVQRPFQLRDGRFCYATIKGFALFRPEDLLVTTHSAAPTCYLTNLLIHNQVAQLPRNPEAIQQIELKAEENFFTLEWTALHYENPEKCQYAYRLAGLDRDWVYTKNPLAQYTNVPGGDYEFECRASLTPDRWDGPIRRIHVHVDTVFYKTWWFIGSLLILIVLAIMGVYQYRMRQAFRLARLQMRTTRLEKDNALVQYQNLINQLNPHFLFNSLAVLDGLITKDAKLAAKYLSRMTKVYRYLIENDRVETVPLKKEMRFVTDFINLLTTRYGRGLQVEVNIPEQLESHKIVPVTFQNLIENAIKHNTTDEEAPLRIRIYAEADYLVIENNLQKRDVVKNSNRKGLTDLKKLYGYLTDRPLTLSETDTTFTVRVPLLSE